LNSHDKQKARRDELRKEKPKKKFLRKDKTGGMVFVDKVRISKGNFFFILGLGIAAVLFFTNYNFDS